MDLTVSRVAFNGRAELFHRKLGFLAHAAHHALVGNGFGVRQRLDTNGRRIVVVRELGAALVSIYKKAVDGLVRCIAPDARNHHVVPGFAGKGNRVFARIAAGAVVHLQAEVRDGRTRQERDKVQHVRIAFEEVATAGNLRPHAPGLFRFGQQLFSGLTLGTDNLDAADGADLPRIEQALQLAVARHAAAIMCHEAALPRSFERDLDLLGFVPSKRDGLFQVAVLAGVRYGDGVLLMTVGGGSNVDDVDAGVGQQIIERVERAAVPVARAPINGLLLGAVPNAHQLGPFGQVKPRAVLRFHHVAAADNAPTDNVFFLHSSPFPRGRALRPNAIRAPNLFAGPRYRHSAKPLPPL